MSGGFKEENTPGRHQRTTRRSNTTAGFGRLSAKLRSGQGSFPSEFFGMLGESRRSKKVSREIMFMELTIGVQLLIETSFRTILPRIFAMTGLREFQLEPQIPLTKVFYS